MLGGVTFPVTQAHVEPLNWAAGIEPLPYDLTAWKKRLEALPFSFRRRPAMGYHTGRGYNMRAATTLRSGWESHLPAPERRRETETLELEAYSPFPPCADTGGLVAVHPFQK